MLTEANVKHFLENVLQFKNWSTVLSNNKQDFLFRIVSKFGTELQYENITWRAIEAHERKLPQVADIISHVMETHGGACVHLNYFLKLLLESLEFRVEIFSSEVVANGLPNNHLVLVVRMDSASASTKEDLYLIDVGMGRPITSPVHLNNLPHRGRAGGFDFEVRFNEENQLHERVIYAGCAIKGEMESQTDGILEVTYDLVHPKRLADFDNEFTTIFTDPTDYFFLNTIFLFRFVSIKSVTDFEFVSVRGRALICGTQDKRSERKFETYAEMADVILTMFPKINESNLHKALSAYDSKRISKVTTK